MRALSKKQKATVAGITLLALTGTGGLAYAYWTQGGSGTGTAASDTTVDVVVNQTGVLTAMYPGQGTQPLSGTFTNPNPGPIFVSSVTAVVRPFISQTVIAKPACTEADYAITGTSSINGIPAGDEVVSGSTWSGLAVELVNRATNQDNCKNVVIDIDYIAS